VGDTVYVGSGDGFLYALDSSTGRLLWRAETGGAVATEGRVRSSPAVHGNMISVGSSDGRLYTADRSTGEVLWIFETEGASREKSLQYNYDGTAVASSPAVAGGTVVFGARDGWLYAVDAETGEQRWRVSHSGSWVNSSAVIAAGSVYVGSSDGTFFHAVELATGTELWRLETAMIQGSGALASGYVYFGDMGGTVRGVAADSGAEAWRLQLPGAVLSSPVLTGGRLFIGSDDGKIYAIGSARGPVSSSEVRKGVFWEDFSGYVHFQGGAAARDFLAGAGYAVLDAASLSGFMRERIESEDGSVVVFAADREPPPIVADSAGTTLLRRYLDSGGKIVWVGEPPLAILRNEEGEWAGLDPSIPERVLGVAHREMD
jgi:outer membrane protein assembly factor BamB